MILYSQQHFTVVRQLSDPTDSSTYYVQAVIRNAYTDAIIDTLNLDDKGSQRFTKNWQVPADPSGQGFYISVVTKVYSDSGYTTQDTIYGNEASTYLVQDRLPNLRGGGGSLDAYTVRRIVQEELDKAKPEPVKFPVIPKPKEYEMRWDEVFGAIAEARDAIARIPKPDLSSLDNRLTMIEQAISQIDVPPPTDLSPLLDQLQNDKQDNELSIGDLKQFIAGIEDSLVNAVGKEVKDELKRTKFVSQFSTTAIPQEPARNNESVPFDLSKLST